VGLVALFFIQLVEIHDPIKRKKVEIVELVEKYRYRIFSSDYVHLCSPAPDKFAEIYLCRRQICVN